jgi:hypothetical protein
MILIYESVHLKTAMVLIHFNIIDSYIIIKVSNYLSCGTSVKERNYFGGFEYEKAQTGSLAMTQFPMSEGRVTCSGSTYAYEYQMKDHLGNVWASFTCDAVNQVGFSHWFCR